MYKSTLAWVARHRRKGVRDLVPHAGEARFRLTKALTCACASTLAIAWLTKPLVANLTFAGTLAT